MKQIRKQGLATVLYNSRLFIMTAIIIGINSHAFASGSKMPDIANTAPTSATEGTVETTPNPEGGTTSGTDTGSTNTGSDTPIPDKYSHLDPGHEVPSSLLKKTLDYYDTHKSVIKNKNFISVLDFKKHNSKERFYIIDMGSGQVEKYLVAHGKNSDPDYDGYATIFSNTSGSEASSVGFYLAAETYEGSHGHSLKLDGLSSTNSNARSRSIVIHPADYVEPGGKIGRSWGCPALEPRYSEQIIDQIKGGSLIYATNVY